MFHLLKGIREEVKKIFMQWILTNRNCMVNDESSIAYIGTCFWIHAKMRIQCSDTSRCRCYWLDSTRRYLQYHSHFIRLTYKCNAILAHHCLGNSSWSWRVHWMCRNILGFSLVCSDRMKAEWERKTETTRLPPITVAFNRIWSESKEQQQQQQQKQINNMKKMVCFLHWIFFQSLQRHYRYFSSM